MGQFLRGNKGGRALETQEKSLSPLFWPRPTQTLEQQLEEMRATYQLNTEKLEYNYRVLTERDMENSATLSHQKRKLSKLKDALSGLVQVGRRCVPVGLLAR